MKKFLLAVFGFALLSGLLPLCAAEGASKHGVASFSPSGTAADNATLKITFDEAIVAKNETGKVLPVSEFPFVTTPPVQAEGKWLDRRTFSATLLAPLDMATAYTVTVREGLKSQRGRPVGAGAVFTFQTSPLRLLNAAATQTGKGGEVDLRLDFNMPVSPSRLRGFLSVTATAEENSGKTRKMDYRASAGLAMKTIHATVPIDDFKESFNLSVRLAAGLTGETGTLGLPKDETRNFTITPVLSVQSVRIYDGYNGIALRVDTNLEVNLEEAKAGGFIEVEPETPFSLDSHYGGAFLVQGDFKPRERYVFTFKKGLPSEYKKVVLAEDIAQAVIMPDLPPSVSFASTGTFLSPAGGGRVPVELVNVRKLDLSLWRLYESNLPYMMRGDYPYFDRTLARRAANRTLDLSLPLNEKARRVIALDQLIGDGENRGLFLLTLNNRDSDYWYERQQIVNLSDIGMAARLWEDGILVWANTLSALEPVEDADVRVYSAAGQVLAEGKTGPDGVWQLQRAEPWSRGEDDSIIPSLATVSRGREVAYVRLTRGLLSREIFDTSGRPWPREGYDAALFSARDIYRTGEKAAFKAVVRNHDLSTPPDSFPVLFVARNPLSRVVKRGTALLSKEGGALFDLDIPGNAMTGLWQVTLHIPGDEERSLAWMTFHVEDFAPPRIEVDLDVNAEWPAPGDDVTLGIAARYLFGADGAGLKWEAEWSAREGAFRPRQEKWASYTFGDAARNFAPQSDLFGSGALDPKGSAETSFTLPPDWDAPSVIDLTLTGRVMEEGGRWVEKRVTFPYCPYPFLIGVTEPNGVPAVNSGVTFRVAAVAPGGGEGEKIAAGVDTLTAALYRVSWNYNLVEVDGYTRWQSSEEYSKIEEKDIALADGTGEVSFTPPRWGTYVLRVSDAKEDARTSVRFYADDPEYAGQDGSQLLDRVEMTTDKESYKVGDVAKVTLRAPFEGLLLFNVEAAKPIRRDVVKVDKAGTIM
ncbi:MAG: Ig-like domain-containing protein, partial [Synergistaceae bacterium]|nr:Ig-like domain-containing protein [Synergistaceae bacterium]